MNHLITALTIQKHNRQRVNVHLDGEFAFGLARIVAAWLQVGLDITDEKIATLIAEDERESAYLLAIRYLNIRPRSIMEVEQYMRNHRVREETTKDVLDRLKGNHLINDAQFARDWVENRQEFRPRSRRAIAYELKKHGIDPKLIEASIESVNENDMAYQAALRQARKLNNINWREFRQKMLRHLAQRGFQYDLSSEVTKLVWTEISTAKPNYNEGVQD
jgi:regulatory protein